MNRRDALFTVVAGVYASSALGAEKATPPPKAPSTPRSSPGELKPLPFNAAKLKGLSEKLLVSHHQNNYGGAMKNLLAVRKELDGLGKDAPGFVLGSLRQRELVYANSVVLHEAYFGNLGGSGKASGAVEKAISAAFGSYAKFDDAFRATGRSLGGGSGWAILDYDLQDGTLRIHSSGDHSQTGAAALPLLVMDMYEHAYALDYGAAAAKYVDAFMANVQWDEVNRRFEQAQQVAALWR